MYGGVKSSNLAQFGSSLNGKFIKLVFQTNKQINSSNELLSIMFAEDTEFFEHSNINALFKILNDELIKMKKQFPAIKL